MRMSLKRKKAIWGEMAAAGITAAATLGAAAMGVAATKKAAKQQAEAIKENAVSQAAAIKDQTRESRLSLKEQQAFTKEQNEQNRESEKVLQQNMLRQLGISQFNDNRESSLIKVRNGGVKKLHSSLRGGSNNHFTITDGGGVKYINTTPQGNDLYEIKGDTHKEYHKTKGGKYKSGVGFKFEDGSVIEGEGAPKGQHGELVLSTPNDVKFISRHSIRGFNPAEAVRGGLSPETAFAIQEQIKAKYGISNNTNKAEYGAIGIPDDELARIDSSNLGILNDETQAKCGGRKSLRTRASIGDYWRGLNNDEKASFVGSGITAGANLIAAGMTNIANNRATRLRRKASEDASRIMSDAYDKLKGINPNSIDYSSYMPQHVMAVTRDARVNVDPELSYIERAEQRQLTTARNNTLSGAARNSIAQRIATDSNDARSRVFANKSRLEEQIAQQNVNTINQVNQFNANLDSQARARIATDKLSILKYNNELENRKILGKAQVNAEGVSERAGYSAQRAVGNINAYTSGLLAGTNSIANTFGEIEKNRLTKQYIDASKAKPVVDEVNTKVNTTNDADRNEWYSLVSERLRGPLSPDKQARYDELFKKYGKARNGGRFSIKRL